MLYVGVDVGGTFTDAIVYDDLNQKIIVSKVPTTPGQLEKGILDSIQESQINPEAIGHILHASTIGTNALLTRSGLARTAFVTNEGFRDVVEIGRQRRAEIYDIQAKRPVPLVERKDRYTIRARISADGSEIQRLSKKELVRLAKKIVEKRYESIAIGFLNSYVNPRHEKNVRTALIAQGFKGHIDLSSEVNNEYREFERFSTTIVNAALSPLLSKYLANLQMALKEKKLLAPVYVMNSDGSASTIRNASRFPVLMIESGPAAGVMASKALARSLSLDKVLTFDMGGTTAKAGAVINYEPDITYEFEAAGKSHSGRSIKGSGYAVRAPFIDLAEVSAGGGTIARVDEAQALKIGPESAGSIPGPAAYGRGGKEPTVTDANIVLGRINPQYLLGGKMLLHRELASNSLETNIANKLGITIDQAAEGIIKLVNNTMARAISIVSSERGRDPREHAMIAFGGAGPIHACDVADNLEIRKIVIPEHPDLFSAYGLLSANIERNFSAPVLEDLSTVILERYFTRLRELVRKSMLLEGFESFEFIESIEVRYVGQSYSIHISYEANNPIDIRSTFEGKHKALYGYSSSDPVEVVSAKIRAVIPIPKPSQKKREKRVTKKTLESRRVWLSGTFFDNVSILDRESLEDGAIGEGPCIIEEYDSTIVVNPLWVWQADSQGNLILTRS